MRRGPIVIFGVFPVTRRTAKRALPQRGFLIGLDVHTSKVNPVEANVASDHSAFGVWLTAETVHN